MNREVVRAPHGRRIGRQHAARRCAAVNRAPALKNRATSTFPADGSLAYPRAVLVSFIAGYRFSSRCTASRNGEAALRAGLEL